MTGASTQRRPPTNSKLRLLAQLFVWLRFPAQLSFWLRLPAQLWLMIFFLAPLVMVIVLSFLTRNSIGGVEPIVTLQNYTRLVDSRLVAVVVRSVGLASLICFLCFLWAVPLAWALRKRSPRTQMAWMLILCAPFFLNLMVRVYSLRVFFGSESWMTLLVTRLIPGLDPFSLSQNLFLVSLAMTITYFPFFFFPVFVAVRRFDASLLEACYDLGGSRWVAIREILLPNLRPALAMGILAVWIPAVGEYVIPDLLGGARAQLLGNWVTDQFLRVRDWPFGATLAVMMLLLLTFSAQLVLRWGKR